MGLRGPAPLPNSVRLDGHSDRMLDAPAEVGADPIPADETWHPSAAVWYRSLARAAQAGEYTDADWGLAWAMADLASAMIDDGDHRGAASVLSAAAVPLMMTRPARLAARLDLDAGRSAAVVVDLPTDAQLASRAGWS